MGHAKDADDPTGALPQDRAARLAATLEAIADPSRLRLLTSLREGPTSPTDLAAALGTDPASVDVEIDRLVEAGLVEQAEGSSGPVVTFFDDHVEALLDEAIGHEEHRRHGLDDRAARDL